jgi:hypothetical protein
VRFNLSQQPQAFAANQTVKALLEIEGNQCLLLILVDWKVAKRGASPTREDLGRLAGAGAETGAPSLYTDAVAETCGDCRQLRAVFQIPLPAGEEARCLT